MVRYCDPMCNGRVPHPEFEWAGGAELYPARRWTRLGLRVHRIPRAAPVPAEHMFDRNRTEVIADHFHRRRLRCDGPHRRGIYGCPVMTTSSNSPSQPVRSGRPEPIRCRASCGRCRAWRRQGRGRTGGLCGRPRGPGGGARRCRSQHRVPTARTSPAAGRSRSRPAGPNRRTRRTKQRGPDRRTIGPTTTPMY